MKRTFQPSNLVRKRRVDPLTALRHRLVGQADDREPWKPGGKLYLDFDAPGFEAEIGDSCDGGGHSAPPQIEITLRRHPPNSAPSC